MGEEGAGMKLEVQGRTLGQDSSNSDIQSMRLHHELMGRVRMKQYGSSVEVVLEVPEHPVRSRLC
jgi:hypothetical protein